MGEPLSSVDLDTLQEQYVDSARQQLANGGDLATARRTWVEFVRTCHGDVFADIESQPDRQRVDESLPTKAFIDTCFFDFVVDSLLGSLEARTGITLQNRNPGDATGALSLSLGSLHDTVLAPEGGRQVIQNAVSEQEVRTLTPEALSALYTQLVSPEVRLALGEYYTPRGLADLAVDSLGLQHIREATVLDPGCGMGVFLTACIDRKRTAGMDTNQQDTLDAIANSVVGIDLNPVAVKAAKLAYCVSLYDYLATDSVDAFSVPIYLTDALGLVRDDDLRGSLLPAEFDTLVGNPPWVPWDRLSERLKTRWRENYVDDLGLQPHDGAAARLGHSNDDISVPFALVAIHRYLRAGGRASFVLKRDIMRGPAGAVLRRLKVGERNISLEEIHDMAALDPFPGVGANTAIYTVRADTESDFPVDMTVWQSDEEPDYSSVERFRDSARAAETGVIPLDPSETASPWLRADAEQAALGTCHHEIRHGLKDDANDVFGLDRTDLSDVESDLVYPFLKSRHVRKYGLTGHDLRLVPMEQAGADNEAWLERTHPHAYDYLASHRSQLLDRASSWFDQGPFYSVFGLGPYTWAPYKVAWCRLGFKPDFTVVSTRTDPDLGERQVVPGDHYMFIATEHRQTAHFLCALLNSAPYQRTLRDLSSDGKASLSKSVVSELALPDWSDSQTSERLAALSMRAHSLVREHSDPDGHPSEIERIQTEIDRLVERRLIDTTGTHGDVTE